MLCQLKLQGCDDIADYVIYLGAGGDCYACGPCMNKAEAEDPELEFISLGELD